MSMIFFTFRAQMWARQAVFLLKQQNIPARMGKTPAILAVNGCGYGIWVRERHSIPAADVMRRNNLRYERSYRMEDGTPVEVQL